MRATILLFCLLAPTYGLSNTIHVPGDYTRIQEAILAAVDGDTILAAPGTYHENIDFLGKAITVKSEQGPVVTVIDGDQAGSVVVFKANETMDSVILGFTITNGNSVDGGGIACFTASPRILGNIIRDNVASMSGGGIFCIHSAAIIDRNILFGNNAGWSGGGINSSKSTTTVTNNIVFKNSAGKRGGGVRFASYTCLLMGNSIFDNWGRYGGGVTSSGSPTIITNNAIFRNVASAYGGGIHCSNDSAEVVNNSLFKNHALSGGGGICLGYDTEMTVWNTILFENDAPEGPELWIGTRAQSSSLTIDYSNMGGGISKAYVEPGCTLSWGSFMLEEDPLFVDPDSGDLHLLYPSPCRNKGDNGVKGLPDYDFEGDPRIFDGTVDMGADEFHRRLYYTGIPVPGGSVRIKLVGTPGTVPVGLFFGNGVLDPPLPSPWGDWLLSFPVIGPIDLGPIPSPGGVMIVPGVLPATPVAPYSIPMQALIGDALTNLCIMEVH